jgi:hypothetical protein
MLASKKKIKLLVAFEDKNSIKRFANFISAINDHIHRQTNGILINFDMQKIQVIYTYENEKEEKENYFNYKREEIPYFLFTYLLFPNYPTHSQYRFEPSEPNDLKSNCEGVLTLRMAIDELISLHKFLSTVINNYSRLFFKAKTITDKGIKLNVLHFQAEYEGIYVNRNFKMKTKKIPYKIIDSVSNNTGCVTINTTIRGLKEIAEKWKNKLQPKKKESEMTFLIKLSLLEKEPRCLLYIHFYFNKRCKFFLRYSEDYEIDDSYKFDFNKYYEVKLEQFINIVNDHNINNYCTTFKLKFEEDEITFGCFTNGLTPEEKDSKIYNTYSAYSVRIAAKCIKDKERIEEILAGAE